MIICTRCNSKLETWELNKGSCPFCFPKVPELVRPMNKQEQEAILAKGCFNCAGKPWKKTMGVHYCDNCGALPPTHVRISQELQGM